MDERVAIEARTWLGTPFRHRASLKGVGCDCLGLVLGVWRAFGTPSADVPAYGPDWSVLTDDSALTEGVRDALVEERDKTPLPGHVLLFRTRLVGPARHMGIVSTARRRPTFIHAYARFGVVESYLEPHWAKRITGIFSLPLRTS